MKVLQDSNPLMANASDPMSILSQMFNASGSNSQGTPPILFPPVPGQGVPQSTNIQGVLGAMGLGFPQAVSNPPGNKAAIPAGQVKETTEGATVSTEASSATLFGAG